MDENLWVNAAAMADGLKQKVIEMRRYLHQYPELSFSERNTSEYILEELKKIPEVEFHRPTETSVMAVIKGDQPGRTLALRADIDALELEEANNSSYCSKNKGIMHACGHDGHTAMLLGVVHVLSKLRGAIRGEVRFIFQHAEEKPPGGARELVQAGVLQGVDMIIGCHLWVPLASGKIGIKKGSMMAGQDNFRIEITGKGGHAALPHETTDPIAVSAQIVTNLQYLSSRSINPLEPFVLSITQIQGGSAHNIIPEKAVMKGTCRTFNAIVREEIPGRMEKIIKGITQAHGAAYKLDYNFGYAPVYNDNQITDVIQESAQKIVGQEGVEVINPVMSSEDFSEYQKYIPGTFFFIGAGNPGKGIKFPHHHPKFEIDEDALGIGIQILLHSTLTLLSEETK